jgi:hypothetical protein
MSRDVRHPEKRPPPAGFSPVFSYNPFTAADEKIALSMVHVNSKPQHLVFSLHSRASDC